MFVHDKTLYTIYFISTWLLKHAKMMIKNIFFVKLIIKFWRRQWRIYIYITCAISLTRQVSRTKFIFIFISEKTDKPYTSQIFHSNCFSFSFKSHQKNCWQVSFCLFYLPFLFPQTNSTLCFPVLFKKEKREKVTEESYFFLLFFIYIHVDFQTLFWTYL